MARIQNKNLKWTEIRLRSGQVMKTDGDGVLEGITEEEAGFLASTPGWHLAGLMGPEVTTKPASTGRAAPHRAVKPSVTPASNPVTEAAGQKEEPEEVVEGPDIDGLKTKKDALDVAKEYGVEGLTEDMKLSDMKVALNKAIYETEAASS